MTTYPSTEALAETYNTPGVQSPLEAIDAYEEYQREWANSELGSYAISTRMELPRGRIRTWKEGGKPDVVRGIETAREHGWLEADVDGEIFAALNRLVAGVFSGGSISDQTFMPSFSAPDDRVDAQLRADLETLGSGCRIAHSNSGNVEELVPKTDASVLGRVLVALGAPKGPKVENARRLPSYLYQHAESTQHEFARVYVANRAVYRADRDIMQIQEKRSDRYLDALAELLQSTTGAEVWRGERVVHFDPAALSKLDLE